MMPRHADSQKSIPLFNAFLRRVSTSGTKLMIFLMCPLLLTIQSFKKKFAEMISKLQNKAAISRRLRNFVVGQSAISVSAV
jgi:hypothetical protein